MMSQAKDVRKYTTITISGNCNTTIAKDQCGI
jgi:hypothetical protein